MVYSLTLLNNELRQRIESCRARFLFEVSLSQNEKDIILTSFRKLADCPQENFKERIKLWWTNYSTLNLFLLVEIGREAYNRETPGFWNNFFSELGIKDRSSTIQQGLGSALLKELRARDLETNIQGYTYVGKILAHAGLPEAYYHDFIKWLARVEPGLKLSFFSDISYSDFCTLITSSGIYPNLQQLRKILSFEEGHAILWGLATLVGECSLFIESGLNCPGEWRKAFMGRLFESIVNLGIPQKVNTLYSISSPIILWEVEEQCILALIEEQRLPAGTSIRLNGARDMPLNIHHYSNHVSVDEVVSGALKASDSLSIKVEYIKNGQLWRAKDVYVGNNQCLIFNLNGRLLTLDGSTAYPHGEYYLLINSESVSQYLEGNSHLKILEEVIEPVGWPGWLGYLISVEPGAGIGPYQFEKPVNEINWEIQGTPCELVNFSGHIPVWLDSWPDIIIKGIQLQALKNSFLEIDVYNHERRVVRSFLLRLGPKGSSADVPLDIKSADKISIMLGLWKEGAFISGHFLIRLRLPNRAVKNCKHLEFIRISNIQFGYRKTDQNFSLPQALQTDLILGGGFNNIVPIDGKVLSGDSGGKKVFYISPEEPYRSPEVRFKVVFNNNFGASLKIKIPVNRVRLIKENADIGAWHKPTIDLSLSDIGINDRLRLELDSLPTLFKNELVCRLVHGPTINAGRPRLYKNTFEIPLHRWRDSLGGNARGLVQVHCGDKWVDIVRLTGSETHIEEESDQFPLIKNLNLAINDLDWQRIRHFTEKILDTLNGSAGQDMFLDLHRIAAAKALVFTKDFKRVQETLSPLKDRPDIPEVGLYLLQARLRQGQLDGGGINDLENTTQRWLESTVKKLVLGELSYRMGRLGHGGKGALASCRRYFRETVQEDYLCTADAYLIDGITAFLLNEDHLSYQGSGGKLFSYCRDVLNVLSCIRTYLNHPMQFNKNTTRLELNIEVIDKLWVDVDINYVKLCIAQFNGDLTLAGSYLKRFEQGTGDNYYAIEVIRARQLYLTGHKAEARAAYLGIINSYPFIIDEIPL